MDYNRGYTYTVYRWQTQKSGYGDGSHGGVINNLDIWGPTVSINRDMTANGGVLAPTINESVGGQAILDWIAETNIDSRNDDFIVLFLKWGNIFKLR